MAPDVSINAQRTANFINPKNWEDITREINIFLRDSLNKCTMCNDFIQNFLDNPEFSMQLHNSKLHKQYVHITRENSNWKYEKGVNYICPVCKKLIPILNMGVAHSVTNHIERSTRHGHQLGFSVKSQKFLENIFSSSLKILKNHEGYFKITDSHLFCQLCEHDLGIYDKNVKSLCALIKGHISSHHHKSQHDEENQKMVNAILCYNKDITSQHEHLTRFNQNVLSINYSSTSKIINKNKRFIKKDSVHYLCKLCKKYICYFPKENTQMLNFIFHFIGEDHKKSLFYKCKNIYFPNGVRFDGHKLKEHYLGYTHEIHEGKIKITKEIIRSPGGGGIPAPSRNCQEPNVPSTTQDGQQASLVAIDDDKMNYESIRILNQHPMFAPHVQLLQFVDGIFMCTLCGVILTLSPSKTDHLVQHILGSRHADLSKQKNIPVPDGSYTLPNGDGRLVCTSPEDQIQKLSLEQEFAPHVQYLRLEGSECQCLICGVFLSVSMFVNYNLKEHIRGSIHRMNFERGAGAVTSEDNEDDNSSDLTDGMESLALGNVQFVMD